MRWNCSNVRLFRCFSTGKYNDLEKCGSNMSFRPISNCSGDMFRNSTELKDLSSKFMEISFQVPETPMWLLSKDRPKEALKSLQWLRGWVPAKNVEKEFADMQRYNVYSRSCGSCQKTKSVCDHPAPTFIQKLQELLRKRNLKPFLLTLSCFAFSQFIGLGLFN